MLRQLHPDPLHLIEAHFVVAPIVELGGASAGVVRHRRSFFQGWSSGSRLWGTEVSVCPVGF